MMLASDGLVRGVLRRVPHALVARGLSPARLGHRWYASRGAAELRALAAAGGAGAADAGLLGWRTLAPAREERFALPGGVDEAAALSDDAGWWGYSLRDVPTRTSGECALLSLAGARLVFRGGGGEVGAAEFHPALLTRDRRVATLREISQRPFHRRQLAMREATRRGTTTWIAERVYDNHSHWLTAHLPKLLLARDHGLLDSVVLPAHRTPVMRASLAALDIDIDRFPSVPIDRPLVSDITHLFVTDRFDARLLERTRAALACPDAAAASADGGDSGRRTGSRLWISRARARGRHLLEEQALLPRLAELGVEPVFLEEHGFDAQRRLLANASLIVAPHGAGLTGILFCRPGTCVVEIVDPDYPNPNFYALAAALGLAYRRVEACATGSGHALRRDLSLSPEAIDALLALPEFER